MTVTAVPYLTQVFTVDSMKITHKSKDPVEPAAPA